MLIDKRHFYFPFMTYSEKLLDPRWQKKRLEILQRDNFTCQLCFDTETTLHIHHYYYDKSGNPWDVEDQGMVTYCSVCHCLKEMELKYHEILLVKKIYYDDEHMLLYAIYEGAVEPLFGIFKYAKQTKQIEHLISLREITIKSFGEMFNLSSMNKRLLIKSKKISNSTNG